MDHLTDRRIIQRHADIEVQGQRHEVMWRDGTTVHLHPVCKAGVPQTFLRALQIEGLHWLVFDLLRLPGVNVNELRTDILRLLPRDTPGIVHFTLRGAYATAGVFTVAAQSVPAATWWAMDAAPIAEAA